MGEATPHGCDADHLFFGHSFNFCHGNLSPQLLNTEALHLKLAKALHLTQINFRLVTFMR